MKQGRLFFLVVSLGLLLAGCFGSLEPDVPPDIPEPPSPSPGSDVPPEVDFTWEIEGSDARFLIYDFHPTYTTAPGHRIVERFFDYGDGTITWFPDHTYKEEGIYTVSLTVIDDRRLSATVTKEVPVFYPAVIQAWHLNRGSLVSVTGLVENRDSRVMYLRLKAKFYDEEGVRVTEGYDEFYLDPGTRTTFSITPEDSSFEIFSADVFISFFDFPVCLPPVPMLNTGLR